MFPRFGSPEPVGSAARSGKKRSHLSRSDEDIDDEMYKSSLLYRTGWPQLPSLTVDTEPATNSIENSTNDIATAQMILRAQKVVYSDIYLAHRVPRDANP
jgi:hypothetical protein